MTNPDKYQISEDLGFSSKQKQELKAIANRLGIEWQIDFQLVHQHAASIRTSAHDKIHTISFGDTQKPPLMWDASHEILHAYLSEKLDPIFGTVTFTRDTDIETPQGRARVNKLWMAQEMIDVWIGRYQIAIGRRDDVIESVNEWNQNILAGQEALIDAASRGDINQVAKLNQGIYGNRAQFALTMAINFADLQALKATKLSGNTRKIITNLEEDYFLVVENAMQQLGHPYIFETIAPTGEKGQSGIIPNLSLILSQMPDLAVDDKEQARALFEQYTQTVADQFGFGIDAHIVSTEHNQYAWQVIDRPQAAQS